MCNLEFEYPSPRDLLHTRDLLYQVYTGLIRLKRWDGNFYSLKSLTLRKAVIVQYCLTLDWNNVQWQCKCKLKIDIWV